MEPEKTDSSVGAGPNIAERLTEIARRNPYQRALIFPQSRDRLGRRAWTQLSFKQLEELSCKYAWGLAEMGLKRGMRTLLMVRPSLDFTALTFALFKLGAVPVMIDPGMGIRGFIQCVRQVEPQALLGVPAAHVLRMAARSAFNSVELPVVLGKSRICCRRSTDEIIRRAPADCQMAAAAVEPEETAAILFTTGSTGPAKGVVYTHGIFATQVRMLSEVYGISDRDMHLPCFPLFSLFSTALGATAVIPQMDPTRPAEVDPRNIVEAVENHGVTSSFGSPALWRTVTDYCLHHQIKLPALKKVLMAGAPIPAYIHDRLLNHILPADAETHTPYGATESLPVADFTGTETLNETWEKTVDGAGVCVGRPVPELRAEIIAVSDQPIKEWSADLRAPPGEVGEIAVKGPVVTKEYFNRPEQTELAKMLDPEDGAVWHRMGDLGYFDDQGRLWVCGRKSHRVTTASGVKYSLCCEAVFNQHPGVYRSALVGVPDCRSEAKLPVLTVEPEPGCFPKNAEARHQFQRELLELGGEHAMTRDISIILFKRKFPVDIRHNAKIKRELLAQWADKNNTDEIFYPVKKC